MGSYSVPPLHLGCLTLPNSSSSFNRQFRTFSLYVRDGQKRFRPTPRRSSSLCAEDQVSRNSWRSLAVMRGRRRLGCATIPWARPQSVGLEIARRALGNAMCVCGPDASRVQRKTGSGGHGVEKPAPLCMHSGPGTARQETTFPRHTAARSAQTFSTRHVLGFWCLSKKHCD